jgi:hypothetical protein
MHGEMRPFTSQEFRNLRQELINAGWQDATGTEELAAGGPTFINGHKRVTLDGVVSFGLTYWRVRSWDLTDTTPSRPAMIQFTR